MKIHYSILACVSLVAAIVLIDKIRKEHPTLFDANAITNSNVKLSAIEPVSVFTTNDLDNLAHSSFKTGLMIGYACAAAGGSHDDIDLLYSCYTNQDVAGVARWFNGRQK